MDVILSRSCLNLSPIHLNFMWFWVCRNRAIFAIAVGRKWLRFPAPLKQKNVAIASDCNLNLWFPSDNCALSAEFPCDLTPAKENRCDCDLRFCLAQLRTICWAQCVCVCRLTGHPIHCSAWLSLSPFDCWVCWCPRSLLSDLGLAHGLFLPACLGVGALL